MAWQWRLRLCRSRRHHRNRRSSRRRRIEFRIAHNSFSRWKYGRVACFIAISEAVRDRLIADGIPRQKTTVVHEGVDVERIVHLPAANVHAAFLLADACAGRRQHRRARRAQGPAPSVRCCRDRPPRCPGCSVRDSLARANCGLHSKSRSNASISNVMCSWLAFDLTCWNCSKESTCSL